MKIPSLKIDELTWTEIAELLKKGWTGIIVPLGSTEQHGPGLPQGVDTWHGEETALRAAKKLGETLVAPAVPFGYSIEHTDFPGTLSLRKKTLAFLLEDIAESLAVSGFKFIYFWFGHGGNWPVAKECLPPIQNKWKGCYVTYTEDVEKYISETWNYYPLLEGIPPEISGSHAGEFEASMVSALKPDMVRVINLAEGDSRPLNQVMEQMMVKGISSISKNGVLGDQRYANQDRGNRYIDCLADWLVLDYKKQYKNAYE